MGATRGPDKTPHIHMKVQTFEFVLLKVKLGKVYMLRLSSIEISVPLLKPMS